MAEYYFYDTDLDGNAEYDIRGDAYRELMQTCCRYSSVLFLKFTQPNLPAYYRLKPFETTKPEYIPGNPEMYGGYGDGRYYRVCPELCDVLIDIAGGVFEWLCGWGFKNPDDPTFYRNDGTIFFASEIHEGVCVLVPRKGEDVQALLSVVDWLTEDTRTWGPNLLRTLMFRSTR